MAPLSVPGKPSTVTLRIVSAAVMLPLAAAAVWLGGWVFAALVSVATALMYWEWQGLCGEKGHAAQGLAAVCAFGILFSVWPGLWAAIVVAVLTGIFLFLGTSSAGHRAFRTAGFAYILLSCISLVWLRRLDPAGMETVIWLGVVVVMTDTCAFFTGKTIGGPKLAPKTSPKKTWAGLLGAIAGAAIGGAAVASVFHAPHIATLGLMGGIFAVIAQLGDLLVSKAKRTFGVKDSSNLIPGHGGVLDRLDGFLSTSFAMAAIVLLGGRSPLAWP